MDGDAMQRLSVKNQGEERECSADDEDIQANDDCKSEQ
jgi:hypothetical protein